MTTIPLRRAVQFEEAHAHFEIGGRGWMEHQHVVRSVIHGHPSRGLRAVELSWAAWQWRETETAGDLVRSSMFLVLAICAIWVLLNLIAR